MGNKHDDNELKPSIFRICSGNGWTNESTTRCRLARKWSRLVNDRMTTKEKSTFRGPIGYNWGFELLNVHGRNVECSQVSGKLVMSRSASGERGQAVCRTRS